MATTETELASTTEVPLAGKPAVKVITKKGDSVLDKVLGLLSSVRFGIVMLSTLLLCCMIGMLVMQVNVDGFQKYYANLKPAQKLVYGALGLFDIYRRGAPLPPSPLRFLDAYWPAYLNYFQLFLAITGLNIILASIDRFPAAWQYIVKPKLTASPKFIAAQMFTAEAAEHADPKGVAEEIRKAWRKHGFRARINEENNRVTVFAQRSVWNRLGAYVVHVALITIFTGGFMTSRYGVGGSMEIKPGKTSDKFATSEVLLDGARESQAVLPFQIECTDLQQKLIKEEGGLDNSNTIDWLSYIRIVDKQRNVSQDMLVHLNNVGDYRGYRFFQNSFLPVGNARQITITFEPAVGGGVAMPPVTIRRNGSAEVPGIGTVRYVNFYPDFDVDNSGPTTLSRDYNNPAAQLEITGPEGKRTMSFAFNPQLAEQYLTKANEKVGKEGGENPLLVNGNKIILRDFEKVSLTHTLTIQYDPGRTPVYMGFTLLVMALCGVFFFSHQRVWAVVEPNGKGSKIYFGGNTNRNRPAFEGRFNSLVQSVTGGLKNE
ncbi:MAG TPA: cytochrome c biogenesis protein ResB [Blastocatellia bacterium]|nr:cytochrome c biogenesis protein ResB [Blastocatellia bacterium]